MDIEKLVEDGARAIYADMGDRSGLFGGLHYDDIIKICRVNSRAVIAIALAAAAEDWIAVAQSGFETWKIKPHNARWFRKIDGTPIPNDLTICIGEAFAERLRTLTTQLGGKADG